jgi:hypothetical protein
VVAFENPPTDEELRTFADPQGASFSVRLDDDGTTLTARPKPFPMWFAWGSLLLPTIAVYVGLVYEDGFNHPDPLFRLFWSVTAIGTPPWVVVFGLFVRWMFRSQIRHDDFFTLDRAAGTLTLPRAGVVLRRGEVVELVEVHATHWVKHSDGWSGDYIRELSVLARGPDGTLIRYPVVAAGHAKPVGRVVAGLSELFGVPRRKLVRALFFGGWRRAG